MPRRKKILREPDYEDELINRIGECDSVISHLQNCPAWNIIHRDLEQQQKYIDENWHLLAEDDNYIHKIRELRSTKLAYMHLLNIKQKYELDLKTAQDELNKIRNTGTKIVKDYDLETNLEKE